MASDRVIEEIKQRLDLVDYINRSVELKRAGRTYKACCPFHVEKTPSFIVFPHTGTWHCFGACGEGGDIFSYVQKREGLSFGEALTLLAREAGVPLEEENEAAREARAERERLVAICEAAMQQYQSWLRDLPEAQPCRDYVARRALSDEIVQRFALGYAPASWDSLLSTLGARGYTPQELARVGLVRERESGGYYDTLRDRLVFPIRDVRGQVIGFGGRALRDEQVPKYLNSPQTPLFDKSRVLYGLELARDAIRSQERAVIVEGYMDVITAHQAGFTNVVASLGTALTGEQVRLLKRYSPNLILALDADTAGQRAAERGLDTVLGLQKELRRNRWERARQGQERASDIEGDIRVLALPVGYDPDDLIKEEPARWERLVAEAQPVVDYLIDQRLQGANLNDPVQKARAASELLPVIAEIESALVRDHYLQRLARLLQTDERTLAQELVKVSRQPRKERREAPPDLPPPLPDEGIWDEPPPDLVHGTGAELLPEHGAAERSGEGEEPRSLEAYLLFLFLERPAFVAEAEKYGLRPDMWVETEHREIFEALLKQRPQSAAHLEEFVEELDGLIARQVRRIVDYYSAYPAIAGEDWEFETFNKMDHFLIRYYERQARQLHHLHDDLQRTLEADPRTAREFLVQVREVEQKKLHCQRMLRERAMKRSLVEPNRS